MNVTSTRGNRGLRALLAALGLAALIAAALRYEGPPDLGWDRTVLPLAALGIGCLGLARAVGTAWLGSALLGSLHLVAQACALQAIDTERYANYAHFAPWSDLGTRLAWLVPVTIQWFVGIPIVRSAGAQWMWGPGGLLRPALVVGVIAFGAAVPTLSLARYTGETVLALFVTGGALLNLWAFARALPAERLATLRDALGRRLSIRADSTEVSRWDRHLPWVVAVFAALSAALFSRFVLGGVPHIDDSISNLFQARTLALGRLSVAAPADSAAFHVVEVINADGRWFGYGFPGWPAVLAIGARAAVPWLVNPLLAGLTVLLTHGLLLRLHGRSMANAGAALLALSPWLLFMSAEMMGHPLSLVLALVAMIAVLRSREGRSWPLLAGLALGGLALTRPLDAAVIGLAAVVSLVAPSPRTGGRGAWVRAAKASIPPLAWMGVAAAAVTALLLAYNHALTGDPLYTPQMMWTDRAWGPGSDRYGFGADIGIRAWPGIDPLPGHGPLDVVLNLNKNLFAAGTDLFGWAGGSLILVLLALALPGRSGRRIERMVLFATAAAYSGYWFAGGPDVGPRYWYIALPALVSLSVAGACKAARTWGHGERIATTVAFASLAALLTFVPWRAATKYYRYRDIGDEIRVLVDRHQWDDDLIFVRAEGREAFQAAFNFLDPAFRAGRPVFARDVGPASRQAVLERFPDRDIWIIGPDSGRDRRLRVLNGPLPPGSPVQ